MSQVGIPEGCRGCSVISNCPCDYNLQQSGCKLTVKEIEETRGV